MARRQRSRTDGGSRTAASRVRRVAERDNPLRTRPSAAVSSAPCKGWRAYLARSSAVPRSVAAVAGFAGPDRLGGEHEGAGGAWWAGAAGRRVDYLPERCGVAVAAEQDSAD